MMNYKETIFFIGKCLTISHEEHNFSIVEKQIKSNLINWDNVVKVATAHYVFPALYCNLKRKSLTQYLPKELVAYMKHITDLNRERNTQIIEQAKEINELLLTNNITPIFLKGTGNLLEGLYEDIAERMVGDIDFIVSKEQFLRTISLLKNANYKRTNDKITNPIISKHYPRLYHSKKIAAIEIHKDMLRDELSKHFNFKSVINSTFSINIFTVLNFNDQQILTILSHQYNDRGAFFKKISLRNSYDTFLLDFKTKSLLLTNNKLIFNLLNNYLSITSHLFNTSSIIYQQNFREKKFRKAILVRLNNKLYRETLNSILKTYLFISLKIKGFFRFITKKSFRKYYIKKLLNS